MKGEQIQYKRGNNTITTFTTFKLGFEMDTCDFKNSDQI